MNKSICSVILTVVLAYPVLPQHFMDQGGTDGSVTTVNDHRNKLGKNNAGNIPRISINEDWAKIIISDTKGKKYTLYLSEKGDELDKFELPPKPPAGSFDVRFTSNRFVENTSSEKTIDITGAEYPIKIGVEGMDLKIKDPFTGDLINAEIKNGEEILIANSVLNKITIQFDGMKQFDYELSQNYPNPFNPNTTIKFQLAKDGFVTLKVYDILGSEVTTLVNEQKKPGKYEVDFNAASFASGIYFYKVTSGNRKKKAKTKLFKEDWGRIILTDVTGNRYTLYAVNTQEDLSKYELPPLPPAGIFDIRYSSGRIAEDLNSPQIIELNGVEYPVTIRVENMGIKLTDVYTQEINKELQPGEELIIQNNLLDKLSVQSSQTNKPVVYALDQNFPNPFNPTTQISWQAPVDGMQTLKVFDVLGNEVAVLVNEFRPAGRYEVSFDASRLASGIYIYRLQAGDFIQTKKMILMK